MSPGQPKVAIVGTSIGCNLHVRALRGAGFDVALLVGRDKDRTQAKADHFRIPHTATSFAAVLDSDVDAVVVATPPATHHPFTTQAISAGKHVLCEKPFSLDIGQAREMCDAAREAGVVGQVVHPNRWYAFRAALRDLVRTGELGEPLQASFTFDHFMLARDMDGLPDWWLDNETGGGWLRNYDSHGIDLVRYMLGEFTAVSGTLHNDPARGMKADDGYAFAFRLSNGFQGVMSGTCRATDFSDRGRVSGTRATVGWDGADAWVKDENGKRPLTPKAETAEALLAGGDHPGAPHDELKPGTKRYELIHQSDFGYPEQVCLARSFRNRILEPGYAHPAVATFEDGLAHMVVILAVEHSAATHRWVDVD